MSENVFEMVNATGEPEYDRPTGDTELQEHEYTELQQLEGVYERARANNTESHEPQYMELEQSEGVYESARDSNTESRVAEQTVSCKLMLLNIICCTKYCKSINEFKIKCFMLVWATTTGCCKRSECM